MPGLGSVERWPGAHGAAALGIRSGTLEVIDEAGALETVFDHASVTKLSSSIAVLVEVAAGHCALDDPVGPPGATLAHLLSHASGLPLDGTSPVAAPGARRIYSNTGIELSVAHASSHDALTAAELLATRVFEPLGMARTELRGSAASGAVGPVRDLVRLASELLEPTRIPRWLWERATSVEFPGLAGVLPGFGRQVPCDFGLGIEVKGGKHPHWTGERWPPWSIGHFGQLGGFVVADPCAGVAIVTLGDEPFGPWAKEAWPAFSDGARDAVVAGAAATSSPTRGDR